MLAAAGTLAGQSITAVARLFLSATATALRTRRPRWALEHLGDARLLRTWTGMVASGFAMVYPLLRPLRAPR